MGARQFGGICARACLPCRLAPDPPKRRLTRQNSISRASPTQQDASGIRDSDPGFPVGVLMRQKDCSWIKMYIIL